MRLAFFFALAACTRVTDVVVPPDGAPHGSTIVAWYDADEIHAFAFDGIEFALEVPAEATVVVLFYAGPLADYGLTPGELIRVAQGRMLPFERAILREVGGTFVSIEALPLPLAEFRIEGDLSCEDRACAGIDDGCILDGDDPICTPCSSVTVNPPVAATPVVPFDLAPGSCPQGWTLAGDHCVPDDPARGTVCPPGEARFFGSTCARVGTECPSGRFAALTGLVVYVDPEAPPGGDGSEPSPFVTIDEAISVAPASSTIALARATFDTALIVLPGGLHLVGACSETIVRGPITVDGPDDTIRNLTLESPSVSLSGGGILLQDVIARSVQFEIRAGGAARFERVVSRGSTEVTIDGTLEASVLTADEGCFDVIANGGASLNLDSVFALDVLPCQALPMINGFGASADLQRLSIARGVQLVDSGDFVLEAVETDPEGAISIFGGMGMVRHARIGGFNVSEGTGVSAFDLAVGAGGIVTAGHVVARRTAISNAGTGVSVSGGEFSLTLGRLSDCDVGIAAVRGSSITLDRVMIEGSAHAVDMNRTDFDLLPCGMENFGVAGRFEAREVVLRNVGDSLSIFGADATLDRVQIVGADRGPLVCDGKFSATDLVLQEIETRALHVVAREAESTLERAIVENTGFGLIFEGVYSVVLDDIDMRETGEDAIWVKSTQTLNLMRDVFSRVRIDGSKSTGIYLEGDRFTATDLQVSNVRPGSRGPARGLLADRPQDVVLERFHFDRSDYAAIALIETHGAFSQGVIENQPVGLHLIQNSECPLLEQTIFRNNEDPILVEE